MAYTVPSIADVRACYPWTKGASDALIENKIAEAASTIGEAWESFGLGTRGVMITTAYLLSLEPEGASMRLKDGTSVYEPELNRLRRLVQTGVARVV
jgi:hypothetical protein